MILLFPLALALVPAASAKDLKYESLEKLEADEQSGLAAYKKAKYERAFRYLKETAARGLKHSQYAIALMYLKGQHLPVDYVRGTAWLGLAAESGDPNWLEAYAKLLSALKPEQRAAVEELYAQLIERYGLRAQNVTCDMRPETGSRIAILQCWKNPGTYKLYPLD